ncbi:Wnt-2b-A [Paramuricea clavata]|uniref:Protein Wnt n=1 Tax=Paramuricea clavata TaxID=317549 RepID=A0A7D9DZN5_PARCT|nr:Wnt-2b-A [Paramuricea clavata]
MFVNTNTSRRKFLHALLVTAICMSAFYVSEGNRTNKKRNRTKASLDIRKYCRAMVWFDKKQRSMCARTPDLIKVVQKAVKNALAECRRQFKSYRWNCSPLTWDQVFAENGILKKRSRETAFVQALTSASVMVEIAKSCAQGNYKQCGCGDHPKNPRRKAKTPGKFSWDGCADDFQYGSHFTKRFMDPRKINNHARKTKSHNQEVGRKVVRQLRVKKCKCHGKSDSCTYRTCWYVTPDITKVGEQIWKLYQNSVRSQWNKTTNVLYDKDRSKREKSQEQLDNKLTYFSKSENFCAQNLPMGIMGTFGRTCNSTSHGNDGCDTMCCGRPHKRTFVTKKSKCNCKFVWCCRVECENCNKTEVEETCQ